MVIIFISLDHYSFSLKSPHYYPLKFQLISNPNEHHEFNFNHVLFFSEDHDTMLHTLQRARK